MAEVSEALDTAIEESNSLRPAFGDIGDYNTHMRYRYRRTIEDIARIGSHLRILEIGAFTGVVSATLSTLGHDVTAHDIPFVIEDPELTQFLSKFGVDRVALDLAETDFPIDASQFDLIVFNEVIEHLNFNAIPLLREFARLLRPGGQVYCATPNLACLKNRMYMLRGKGYLSPIGALEMQLLPGRSTSVGLHWREWTKSELVDLFGVSGFQVREHWYRRHVESTSGAIRRALVGGLYGIMPALMPGQVGVFTKV
ncbi:class I SAM-dependent methyltransferase [Allorhodopirellula solitaria]|uniref:Bifunctional 3-demethylubiquinone-9 3-methyltransferase/ 2-octaprenyl-6-hydroxy phenol methylase n=1 Tax=Allorhodopirellula solitaria TaxID=2527987 RepID=A0A5C5YHJ2_9BACT|nr:class I SAM-dependent methyltransferase [Allorhodopirellula solitaria]TWT72942.1 bifunctional 3-demethylubiquinone-9 3-methyltransferase/ 2-octaprenyl-6-hydroxy phenol methylase [Allorhodopirellula solitaria]